MEKSNRTLTVVFLGLAVSVLLTGSLAAYLTLTLEDSPLAGGVDTTASSAIAFVSDVEGMPAVYVMQPDGSQRHRVSSGPAYYPSWSPGSTHVAYVAVVGDPNSEDGNFTSSVWVAQADGSEELCVSRPISHVWNVRPAWSPDGEQLAFVAPEPGAGEEILFSLHFARSDGSGIERSVRLPWQISQIVWSPAGDDLLLVRGPGRDVQGEIYRLPAGESEPAPVFVGATSADWSPDGQSIAVSDLGTPGIILIGPDGEQTLAAQLDMQPMELAWSPNGTHFAIVAAGHYRQGYGTAVYVASRESREITTVVDGEGMWVSMPAWSPDGQSLLFTMGEARRRENSNLPYANLYRYDLPSGSLEQLTSEQGFAGLGAWGGRSE